MLPLWAATPLAPGPFAFANPDRVHAILSGSGWHSVNIEKYDAQIGSGDLAAKELAVPATLAAFRAWLDKENCVVAGINGFPFGPFHGQAVKDNVFAPDWCEAPRLEYTNRHFALLAAFGPLDKVGTVSTLPGSFKGFGRNADELKAMRRNLLACAEHLARLRDRTGMHLRLALEPEPIGHAENTPEALRLFEQLRAEEPAQGLVDAHLGIGGIGPDQEVRPAGDVAGRVDADRTGAQRRVAHDAVAQHEP